MALGGALYGPGASDCGPTGGPSLSGYEVPRAADPPKSTWCSLTALISLGWRWRDTLIALAPAIANAIFAVTGRRRVR